VGANKKLTPAPELWQVELHALTEYGDPVILYFVALAQDGEQALDVILKEHQKELRGFTIEKEIYEPLNQNSLFIDYDIPTSLE
jgi:hypothetical protein